MILHKIFHLNQPVENAQSQLADVASYRHLLGDIERAEFTGHGLSHWQARLAPGLRVSLVVSETETAAPGTLVFRSLDGNARVSGVVTLHSIRPRLTEVDVVLDYTFRSPVLRVLDRVFGLGNRFLARQLRTVRAHFAGTSSPVRAREVRAAMPAFALKAA